MSIKISNLQYSSDNEISLLNPKVDLETDELNDLQKYVMDLTLPIETRLSALNKYYEINSEYTLELINRLGMMYEFSGTTMLKKYLLEICKHGKISPLFQSILAKSLYSYNQDDDGGYEAISVIYPNLGDSVGTPYKITLIKILMRNEKYNELSSKFLFSIIDNIQLDCKYRYKIIIEIEDVPNSEQFIKECCMIFVKNEKNDDRYRILASQNLLVNSISDKDKNIVENILLSFYYDEKTEYNTKADAIDVLLKLGSDENKELAKKLIMKLGTNDETITIYDNKQNVHTVEVEKSIERTLEILNSLGIAKIDEQDISFDYVSEKILKYHSESNSKVNLDKIMVSLNRIYLDKALYSTYNCTLVHILILVWTYINRNEHENEMYSRLLEELEEMAGTCSSGFASRLVNSISGFGDFTIGISWRHQITSNLNGRLNARIRNMDNIVLRDKILAQMTSVKESNRKQFLGFFRKEISSIREEMYTEFSPYISDDMFDLYFRSAISVYETGEFS